MIVLCYGLIKVLDFKVEQTAVLQFLQMSVQI